jgi:hypothetical protein
LPILPLPDPQRGRVSTNLEHLEQFGPPWTRRAVMVFAGQHDTHIKTGEDYDTRTLGSIFTLEPSDKPKGAGLAFIPSSYCDYDGREHRAQRERGEFVALTGDVDKGDHPLERIETMVRAFAGGSAWFVFSSAHARPGDRRWRIILPLDEPACFDTWHDAQNAFFRFMENAGITMDWALDRAAQPVYLPNVPVRHDKSGVVLRSSEGKPLFYERSSTGTNAAGLRLDSVALSAGLEAIERQRLADDAERQRIRIEAERKRANRPITDKTAIIDDFNESTSVETLLEVYKYQRDLRHNEDWKSPHQQGETFATRVIGSKWISLSSSDAAAGLGDRHAAGCYGDAYDLYVHYEHSGDHRAAFRALHAERKAAQGSASKRRERNVARGDVEGSFTPQASDQVGQNSGEATPLPLLWYNDIQPTLNGNWIVKNVLPAEAFATIIGHPGCGKSFAALDLALHIAAGKPWQARKVRQGLVIYLAAEGQRGQQNRVEAWRRHHGIDELHFAMIPVAINLRDREADVPDLMATIHAAAHQADRPVSAIFVDTLNRTFGGGDENGPEMTDYVDNVGRLKAEFGSTVIVIHHIPKNSEQITERGHGSLRGAIETSLVVKADAETGQRTMHCSKQKDAEDGWTLQFKLKVIELGEDEDGDAVTSCVVEEQEPNDALITRGRGPHLSATQRSVYNELLATLEASPVGVPRDIPEGLIDPLRVGKVVALTAWRERWIAIGGADMEADSARRTFRRAITELKNKNLIGVWNDHAWATFV